MEFVKTGKKKRAFEGHILPEKTLQMAWQKLQSNQDRFTNQTLRIPVVLRAAASALLCETVHN
jgi:hypothetical protein